LGPADTHFWLAQAQAVAPQPYSPVSWTPYSGGAAILLAILLLALAGGCAYAGRRLARPLSIAQQGRVAAGFMIAIWLLTICNFAIALLLYGLELKQAYPTFVSRHPRVGTGIDAPVTFFVILYLTRRWGWRLALASAFIGMAAAPMLFELPFDLIVMRRTIPPLPTYPAIHRLMFFLPLFLMEFSTMSLLTLLPTVRVTAGACYAVAGMFAVFALWAAFGFAFPSEPLPLALNVISKILCFVAGIMLFVWREEGDAPESEGRRSSGAIKEAGNRPVLSEET